MRLLFPRAPSGFASASAFCAGTGEFDPFRSDCAACWIRAALGTQKSRFVVTGCSEVGSRPWHAFVVAGLVLVEWIFRSYPWGCMSYLIEPIGTMFSNKSITDLADRFTFREKEGFRFHSVFQVSQPGCLGIGQGTTTYLAVYVKEP